MGKRISPAFYPRPVAKLRMVTTAKEMFQRFGRNDAPWEYCIPALGNEDLVGTNRSKWEPKQRDLVAVRDSFESVWHLRIFKELKIRDDKKFFVTFGCTSHSEGQEWDCCEPAKNHFEFNS